MLPDTATDSSIIYNVWMCRVTPSRFVLRRRTATKSTLARGTARACHPPPRADRVACPPFEVGMELVLRGHGLASVAVPPATCHASVAQRPSVDRRFPIGVFPDSITHAGIGRDSPRCRSLWRFERESCTCIRCGHFSPEFFAHSTSFPRPQPIRRTKRRADPSWTWKPSLIGLKPAGGR